MSDISIFNNGETIFKVGTLIEHRKSHKLARITDTYQPPDSYAICITYRYVDSDQGRTIMDTSDERFSKNWEIKDVEPVTP
jgi:hypothetical protein